VQIASLCDQGEFAEGIQVSSYGVVVTDEDSRVGDLPGEASLEDLRRQANMINTAFIYIFEPEVLESHSRRVAHSISAPTFSQG